MSPARAPRTQAGRAAHAARAARRRWLLGVVGALLLLTVIAVVGKTAVAALSPGAAAQEPASGVSETTASAEPTASQPATTAPEPSGPTTITIAAVGDMIFDRQVAALIAATDGEEPLEEVASQLAGADITVGNLESPLSTGGTQNADKDITFRGDPAGAEGLALAGFDFVSLANNHVLDYGSEALQDTIATLDSFGIGHAGAGMNKSEASAPAVAEVDGMTVAFLSFSHILPSGFIATDSRAGLAQGRLNMDEVEAAIRAADAEYDYVLVSFHWGVEYEDNCNGDQVKDAHRAVDAGADMVLSHHPHVIQAVEYYDGALIAYSLGDFVFDHYSRKTGEAFILEADLGPYGVSGATATPVYLDEYGKPEYVTGDAAATILSRLQAISAPRGTTVEITGDTARILP